MPGIYLKGLVLLRVRVMWFVQPIKARLRSLDRMVVS